jgi:hypothetical protein
MIYAFCLQKKCLLLEQNVLQSLGKVSVPESCIIKQLLLLYFNLI